MPRKETAAEKARRLAAELTAAGKPIELLSAPDDVTFTPLANAGGALEGAEAPKGEGDDKKLGRFKLTAYTGVAMLMEWWAYPVAIDLKGLRISKRSRPVLLQHNRTAIVGHTETIDKSNGKLTAEGVFSGSGPSAREVRESGLNGFPWRVSVGAQPLKMVFVEEGKTAQVNGREITGPAYIARKAVLGEISFVSLAADDDTGASIAASAKHTGKIGVTDMDFQEWLKAKGFEDPDELSEAQTKFLTAAFDAEQAAGTEVPITKAGEGDGAATTPDKPDIQAAADKAAAAAIVTERKRVDQIEAACKGFDSDEKIAEWRTLAFAGKLPMPDLLAKLVDHLREARPEAPSIHIPQIEMGPAVIEAAVCQALQIDETEKVFEDKTLEAAHKQYHGEMGLQELLLISAASNGYAGRWAVTPGNLRAVLEAAFPIRAAGGFSTLSLTTILSNTANKLLLAAFNFTEQTWRTVGAIGSVGDFKAHTRVRLTGDQEYDEVGPDGELKHGTFGEQEYSIQAKTYGRMQAITRTDIINDDLGALKAVPTRLGRGGGLKVNTVFWTAFLANHTTFWTTTLKNYASGTATALASAGLGTAEQMFLDQTDPDSKPLGAEPRILLTPTALKVTGQELMESSQVHGYGGSTERRKQPSANIWAGKFQQAVSRYLSNSAMGGGYSSAAWYLLADPRDVAVIRIVFLNGKEAPTIESAEANFNVLGIEYRGYHDFGVAQEEYRGGVKMAGA